MIRNKSQLFKETSWVITFICHWSTSKSGNMQTCSLGFVCVHLHLYSTLDGKFSFGKTSGLTAQATGNEILLQVVYYEIRSWCISQENQIGYDGGDGTIIFIAWVQFFSLEKLFILMCSCYKWLWQDILINIGKFSFQQYASCKSSIVFVHHAQPKKHLHDTKRSETLFEFFMIQL